MAAGGNLAASGLSDADKEELNALNEDMAKAGPGASHQLLRENNYRFHFRLYERAKQPQTLDFVRILWAKYPFDLLTVIPGCELAWNKGSSLFGGLRSSVFELSALPAFDVFRGASLLFGIGSLALPAWDQ